MNAIKNLFYILGTLLFAVILFPVLVFLAGTFMYFYHIASIAQ